MEAQCNQCLRYTVMNHRMIFQYFALKRKIAIPHPHVAAIYNKSMGGVDKLDFLFSLYRISIRSKKRTIQIFDHFIVMVICNYNVICYEYNNGIYKDYMDLLSSRYDIADGILALSKQNSCSRKSGRPKNSTGGEKLDSPTTSEKVENKGR